MKKALIVIAAGSLLLAGCHRGLNSAAPLILTNEEPIPVIQTLIEDYPQVWQTRFADIDNNGAAELLFFGHENKRHAQICHLNTAETPSCEMSDLLPPGRDRHSCTGADLNSDQQLDWYCSTGAGKGHEVNPNELWLSNKNGQYRKNGPYRKARSAWGAEQPTARGRRAEFFNLDNDGRPDLITTTCCQRDDGKSNQTTIWRNAGRAFELDDFSPAPHFGGRCLIPIDLNKDGFDEILGCNDNGGLGYLANTSSVLMAAATFGLPNYQYFSMATTQAMDTLVAATGGIKGRMFIDIHTVSRNGAATLVNRLACEQPNSLDPDIAYCGAVVFADMNGDGVEDVVVSRRLGWLLDDLRGDAADLIIYGPDFTRASTIPATDHGMSYELLAIPQGVVQINAGEKWSGSVRLIKPFQTVHNG